MGYGVARRETTRPARRLKSNILAADFRFQSFKLFRNSCVALQIVEVTMLFRGCLDQVRYVFHTGDALIQHIEAAHGFHIVRRAYLLAGVAAQLSLAVPFHQ